MNITKEERRQLIRLYNVHRKASDEAKDDEQHILQLIEDKYCSAMRETWRILGIVITYDDMIEES